MHTLFWACKLMLSYSAQICPNFNLSWERSGDFLELGHEVKDPSVAGGKG